MDLNTFLLFDGGLMLVGLPILMICKGKKSNVNLILLRAKNNSISLTKS